MPDVFITLEEAATFESVKYNTLVQRMKRNPEQYRTQAQAQEGGGKDRTLSPLWRWLLPLGVRCLPAWGRGAGGVGILR